MAGVVEGMTEDVTEDVGKGGLIWAIRRGRPRDDNENIEDGAK